MSTHQDRGRQPAPGGRYIHRAGDTIALLEVRDGDADIVGPATSIDEAERIAQGLLGACGLDGSVPVALHKLALAVLSLRGVERLGSPGAAARTGQWEGSHA